MIQGFPSLGASLTPEGVVYRLWAPEMTHLAVDIETAGKLLRKLPMEKDAQGYHTALDSQGRAGDAYGFRIGGGPLLPDPASRAQAGTVHGRALVVDSAYAWTDQSWQRPPFRDLAIYELHVGTFTPEGTFRAVAEKLGFLRDLGVTAIQLMPIADFPGQRNWGYDGVLIYAPAHCYGSPEDLRFLVDRAHAHGLAVILDVVYNHFGPDGNYLSAYSPHYFNKRHHTPWGDGFNFDTEGSFAVRQFFVENPVYWMEQFHIDGFRFDATHEIQDDSSRHILADLTEAVHQRGGYAIAEDSRNDRKVITPIAQGGLGFDALWADDFHHSLRVSHTGETHSYFKDFTGTLEEIIAVLDHGWLFHGQKSTSQKKPRGTEGRDLPPQGFLFCIANHDQTGNRALGERLNHLVSPAAYRAFSALLCLCPYTPMLFMGQEWATAAPFLYFTDHNEDLGRKVTEGRQREFAEFPQVSGRVPDPQALDTFEHSKLPWAELDQPEHRATLQLYQECLRLRGQDRAFRPGGRESWKLSLEEGVGRLVLTGEDQDWLLLFNLQGDHRASLPKNRHWTVALSTEEPRFGGNEAASRIAADAAVTFAGPEVMLLSAPKQAR